MKFGFSRAKIQTHKDGPVRGLELQSCSVIKHTTQGHLQAKGDRLVQHKTVFKHPGIAAKIHNIILIMTLILGIPIVCFGYLFVYLVSGEFVSASPQLAFMRWPMLIGGYVIITAMLALVISLLCLAFKSIRKNLFDQGSIRSIFVMGHFLLTAFLGSLFMTIYAYVCLGHEAGLLGAYMIVMTLILFSLTNFVYFLGRLFCEAVEYKEENDLTV